MLSMRNWGALIAYFLKSEPFCKHFIILSLIKMAEATAPHRRIIVPAPISNGPYHHPHSHEHPHEESKTTRQNKLFIAPKHRSHPLALQRIQPPLPNTRKFPPTFDSFELSHLYSAKPLSQQDFALFAEEMDQEKFKTPERGTSYAEKGWSSFKLVDNPLYSTTTSNKLMRGPDGKKSRPKEKGLRKLSQRAYEIVLNMRSASYKEVANRLVDELNSEQELDQEGKDQQNIKRRVYDALNVLIALGVLRKEGRKIAGDRENQLHFQQGAQKFREELLQKESQLERKREKSRNLEQKYALYRQLVEDHRQERQETQPCERREQPKVYFPFLALCMDKEGELRGFRGEDGQCSKVQMSWQNGTQRWGHFDVDLLVEYHRALQKMDET